MLATSAQLEVLDLRHFSAAALRPLLEEEAALWERRLLWDYTRSIDLLLEYINSRSLTGYVALRHGRVTGYAFGVCEATKAVIGDLYAFGEGDPHKNPVCEVLLEHLLETLQSTPGIHRAESQLLLFPNGGLGNIFRNAGFRPFPRCFMVRDLRDLTTPTNPPSRQAPTTNHPQPTTNNQQLTTDNPRPTPHRIDRWQPETYLQAAALIQQAYLGHTDSDINDQYRTLTGAQRFLHNIVHFPGCGLFDPTNSWLLHNPNTAQLDGIILTSRVRQDAAHITQLCIRPSLRGTGLGSALLTHCLIHLTQAGLKTVSLTVTASNHPAMHLYQNAHFQTHQNFEAWVWDKPH